MRGFAPRKHPAPGLQPGMHRKTTFCFSANTCWQTVTPGISRQPANAFPVTSGQHLSGLILYRALHFQVITTSLPAPAGNSLSPHIFSYQPTQPHASPQPPFRLDRPARFRSHSFSLFLLFHSIPHTSTHKKKGNRQNRFPSLSLAIPNLVQI